ncbi:hypothetical protein KW507_15810 [Vibrio fluvialis]|nr:hypothetical protein [Vibrio fluvialis]
MGLLKGLKVVALLADAVFFDESDSKKSSDDSFLGLCDSDSFSCTENIDNEPKRIDQQMDVEYAKKLGLM